MFHVEDYTGRSIMNRIVYFHFIDELHSCIMDRMDLEIRHLKLVHMIAREGGMTAASRRLFLTQSALSHQLREIENRLGTQLFLRVNRQMILTEAGRRIMITAQTVLAELERAEQEVRRLAEGREGSLRISTQCNTCYHWLPGLIQKFHKTHPGIDVQINVEATDDPFGALWNGKLDLALLYSIPGKKGLKVHPLFNDELVAILHPDHPLASRAFLHPRDFLAESLILYKTAPEQSYLFQKVLLPSGIFPSKVTFVMLTEAIIEMVKTGLGISVMSRWITAPYVREKTVRAVRVTKKGLVRKWIGASIDAPSTPQYVSEFTRLLAKSALPALR
jgi:LysR family transcriptional regulator for metE and metH